MDWLGIAFIVGVFVAGLAVGCAATYHFFRPFTNSDGWYDAGYEDGRKTICCAYREEPEVMA